MAEVGTPPAGGRRARRNTRPRDSLGRPLPYGSIGAGDAPAESVVRTPRQSLTEAQALLDAGRPFHAHEVLEDAWKTGPAAERELWRGLAQLAVGVTHAARGNPVGAARLIERGAAGVAAYRDAPPHGIDVAAVLRWCEHSVAAIGRESPLDLAAPPLADPDADGSAPTPAG
jgi:hypothetical protein